MVRRWILFLSLAGLAWAQPTPSEIPLPQAVREETSLVAEDLLKMRYFSEASLSPDGQILAYVEAAATSGEGSSHRSRACWLFQDGRSSSLLEEAFQPSWSPDGKALALLQADGEQVKLKVWWRERQRWSVLRHAAVDWRSQPSFRWLNNGQILLLTQMANPSKRPSPVILDSEPLKLKPRQQIVEWNPDSGSTRLWAQGVFRAYCPSPTQERLAVLRLSQVEFPRLPEFAQVPEQAQVNEPASELVLYEGEQSEKVISACRNPRASSLQWSDDGRQLLAQAESGQWWVIEAATGRVQPLDLQVDDCRWLGRQLLQHGQQWTVNDRAVLPASALVVGDSQARLALVQGEVLALDSEGATKAIGKLPSSGPLELEAGAAWPVLVRQAGQRLAIDQHGSVQQLPEGPVLAASPAGLWLSNPEQTSLRPVLGPQPPHEASLSLEVPASSARLIKIAGGLGGGAGAPAPQGGGAAAPQRGGADWLLLPPGKGPFPTVVWLDPEAASHSPPSAALLSGLNGGLNAHLLVAQGYACYFPQMPWASGNPSQWLESALPDLCQRLRAQPLVDGERLAILGQGLGGWVALMASKPNYPFRATLAINPVVELLASTQLPEAQEALLDLHRQSRLYRHRQSWSASSPIVEAGQIQAPVLLISGEEDDQMPSCQRLFSALYLQGKPARLVRYPQGSPRVSGNQQVLNQWHQISRWLQRYLPAPEAAQLP